jgi:hypothetical protein
MGWTFKEFMIERQTTLIERKVQLREEVKEQLTSNNGIFNNHYRLGSEAFFDFIEEAKSMYNEGLVDAEDGDKEILESDLGEWAAYGNSHVPLDLPMVVVEDPREHDFRGGERERDSLLNDVIKPAYSDAKVNMQDAQKDGHDEDVQAFGQALAIYRQMGKVLQSDQPYGKLVKMFRQMPEEVKIDFSTYLKRLNGPDAHDIRRKFFTNGELDESEYQGKDVELNKPSRGGPKKYYVYVKNDKGNVVKVNFGDSGDLKSKINDPEARKNFASRHNCSEKKDKTKAGYWSCNLPRYADQLGLSGGGNFYW